MLKLNYKNLDSNMKRSVWILVHLDFLKESMFKAMSWLKSSNFIKNQKRNKKN